MNTDVKPERRDADKARTTVEKSWPKTMVRLDDGKLVPFSSLFENKLVMINAKGAQ